jgi:brefeldin A-inhibited guanine nucleotide-exchange protein
MPQPKTAPLPVTPPSPGPPPTPPEKASPPTLRRPSLPLVQPNGTHTASPSMSTNSLPSAPSPVGTAHRRSLTISRGNTVSSVLITSALETIAASREAKKSTPLRESTHKALELVRANLAGDQPRQIFEPLRLACETRSEKLMIASLDCITKLISHSFFVDDSSAHLASLPSPPPSPGPGRRDSHSNLPEPSLVDLVVHAITSCHTETSPDAVSLQVVRALLALVLSTTILVHQSALLKAVRTVYNIFLMSNDPVNQTVAQGSLTQMVNHVFTRCKTVTPYEGADRESVTDSGISGISSRRNSVAPSTPDSVPAPALPAGDSASERGEEASKEEHDEQDVPVTSPADVVEPSPLHS